jgi:DNA polymerase-3 subunit delta
MAEANVFKLVDVMAAGRADVAAELLHRVLSDPKEDPFRLYGMIVRQFRLLLLTREHLASGGSPDSKAVATALDINPYAARSLPRLAQSFTLAQLESIYRLLQDTDLKMKTGRIDPLLALDLLVAQLADE